MFDQIVDINGLPAEISISDEMLKQMMDLLTSNGVPGPYRLIVDSDRLHMMNIYSTMPYNILSNQSKPQEIRKKTARDLWLEKRSHIRQIQREARIGALKQRIVKELDFNLNGIDLLVRNHANRLISTHEFSPNERDRDLTLRPLFHQWFATTPDTPEATEALDKVRVFASLALS